MKFGPVSFAFVLLLLLKVTGAADITWFGVLLPIMILLWYAVLLIAYGVLITHFRKR